MIIPENVLKELGVEELHAVEEKELDMFDKVPYPMKSVARQAWFDLDCMKEKFKRINSIYTNYNSYKCTEEEIYSMEAYDTDSIKNGQFLVDNMDRVCVWSGDIYMSAFVVCFTYSCREHELKVKLNASNEEYAELLSNNLADSNLFPLIKADSWLSNLYHLGGEKAMLAIASVLKENGYAMDIIEHIFNNCEFIPLVIIDEISRFQVETKSHTFGDIKQFPEVMNNISDFLGMADVKPNRYKFYFVKNSFKFGWYLKRDDGRKAIAGVADIEVPTESVRWVDIKNNFAIRCGLNNYLAEVDYPPVDDIYYEVNVNETTNELWLKRDKNKSPKSVSKKFVKK